MLGYFKSIINYIKSWFSKKEEDDMPITAEEIYKEDGTMVSVEELDRLDYKTIEFFKYNPIQADMLSMLDHVHEADDPEIVGNKDSDKVLLVVDDIKQTELLYRADLQRIKTEFNLDVYKDYKIVKCLGTDAVDMAYKYVYLDKQPVHKALVDITLGTIINYRNFPLELDGIDMASIIKENNPNYDFILCTAHDISINSTNINKFKTKCKNTFNKPLEKLVVSKNGERYLKFKALLYPNN